MPSEFIWKGSCFIRLALGIGIALCLPSSTVFAESFEIVTSFGGDLRGIHSQPGRVWIAQGSVIYHFDVTQLKTPKLLSKKRLWPDIGKMFGQGNLLVITKGYEDALLLDYSDPKTPLEQRVEYALHDTGFPMGSARIHILGIRSSRQRLAFRFTEKSYVPVADIGNVDCAFNGDVLYEFTYLSDPSGAEFPYVRISGSREITAREGIGEAVYGGPDGGWVRISAELALNEKELFYLDDKGAKVVITSRDRIKPEDRWFIEFMGSEIGILDPKTFALNYEFEEPRETAGRKAEEAALSLLGPMKSVRGVRRRDSLLYCSYDDGEIGVWDVSDLTSPVQVKTEFGTKEYEALPGLTHGWGGFSLDPEEIEETLGQTLTFQFHGSDGSAVGRAHHVSESEDDSPGRLQATYLGFDTERLYFGFQRDHRYFMPPWRSLKIFRVTPGPNGAPELAPLSEIETLTDPRDVAVSGDLIYIADAAGGIVVARRKAE